MRRGLVGAGLVGVVSATIYTGGTEHLWLAAGVLVATVAMLATIVAHTDVPVALDVGPVLERRPRTGARAATTWALLAAAAVATAVTAVLARRTGTPAFDATDVAVPWIASMGLVVAAASWPSGPVRGSVRWGCRPRSWSGSAVMPWLAITVVAAVPRFIRLERFPTIVISDEAAFMLAAADARAGRMVNPFATGFFSNPDLFPAAQGWLTPIVGDGVAGHRVLSALIGTLGVLAAWRLGIRVFGRRAAAVGAVVLAARPLHVHSSRLALNFVTDPTALTLAVLLLLRAVDGDRSLDAVLCGVALGFGLNGYYGGRSFPVVIGAVLVVLVATRQLAWRGAARVVAWVGAGFLTTAMPLIMFFVDVPGEFGGHLQVVSTISLDALRSDPGTTVATYAGNLDDAALYPVAGNGMDLFFRHDPPYLGWPVAITLVIGAAAWFGALARSRRLAAAAWFVVPWTFVVAGVALTVPVNGHRLLALTPLVAMLSGYGVTSVAEWLAGLHAGLARRREAVGFVVATAAVSVVGVVHLAWTFSEDRQFTTYGDPRTTAAWDLGWRLGDGRRQIVLFAGAPAMYADGFHNLELLAPSAEIDDVLDPIRSPGDAPALPPGTALVLVYERAAERCAIERAHPEAQIAETRSADGQLLYTVFSDGALTGWSTWRSPAATTLTPVAAADCPR